MTTQISGTTGCSQVQAGSIQQDDLAANVVGKGPAFRAYSSIANNITTSFVKVKLQSESFDVNGAFDSTTNYRFQPTIAGYYQISGCVQFSTGTYNVQVAIYKNGSVHSYGNASVSTRSTVSDVVYLNGSSDYVELFAISQTAQNTTTGEALTYFSGVLVRAA